MEFHKASSGEYTQAPDGHDLLRVSQLAERTAVLGPGSRAVIWVHGCCFDCPGCLAQRYKTGDYREYGPDAIAQWYRGIEGVSGLTISGGEPMLQPGPLARAIARIREGSDAGVIVYTGFSYESLLERSEADPELKRFLGCIDLLIDGPYIRELDDAAAFRGSSNQRLIPLTDRYRADLTGYYAEKNGRQIEIIATPQGTVMIGVPDRDQLAIWDKLKAIGVM